MTFIDLYQEIGSKIMVTLSIITQLYESYTIPTNYLKKTIIKNINETSLEKLIS